MEDLDPAVLRYYTSQWDEDARLREGLGELEFLRTQELIRRHLPARPVAIADVGGGSGIHADWLVREGHSVTLVDPVPLHIEQAGAQLGDTGRFRAVLGDARSLPLEDASVDATLLLGPLYHLTERDDRVRSFQEAVRVTRRGGGIIAASITRFASLFAGLEEGEIFVPDFQGVIRADLATGQHRNPEGRDYFTTAFFHHPDELLAEAKEACVVDPVLFAVEGPVMRNQSTRAWWNDATKREVLLEFVRAVEQEPSLVGIGPHVLLVGTTPS